MGFQEIINKTNIGNFGMWKVLSSQRDSSKGRSQND